MELRILNIDDLLIKVNITDGKRTILDHIGISSFALAVILKTVQNGGCDPDYRVLTSLFLIRMFLYQYFTIPREPLGRGVWWPLWAHVTDECIVHL